MITTKFKCKCGNEFEVEWKHSLTRSLCKKCDHEVILPIKTPEVKSSSIHRQRLTEWQKQKLAWYKDEKQWAHDIENRKTLPNGRAAVMKKDGSIERILPDARDR